MITIETLIENIKKIKAVNGYILSNKRNLQNCGIYDDDPFRIDNYVSEGKGSLYFLNYNLNQEGIPVDNELIKFLEEFEENEFSIEYEWNADGHFEGRYWRGSYDNPPEYPEWNFDKFEITSMRFVDRYENVVFEIPSKYYDLIDYFIDEEAVSDQLEEDRNDCEY